MNWMKMIGATGHELENDWLKGRYDLIDQIRFAKNKRPSGVSYGDRMVLYAAGWERIYGVAVVKSPSAREDLAEERWPWVLDVEVPIAVPRLELAPTLAELGVPATSVRQQSHIKLSDDFYAKALDLLTEHLR